MYYFHIQEILPLYLHFSNLYKARDYDCVNRFFSKLTPPEEIARELEEIYDGLNNKNTEEKISNILLKLGFSYSLKGTKLMNDCILYSITEDEDNIKKIYNEIAIRKGENSYTIKSDINTAIRNMWRFSDRDKVRKILRMGQCDRPSSKGIISMVKYHLTLPL